MATAIDNTQRFADRVEYYAAYRPGYPDSVIQYLRAEAGLTPDSVVADVGAGTGLSSELFLRHGHMVHAVEPNAGMRHAAQLLLRQYTRHHSVEGVAECTTLPDECADFAVCGSAFHWFDATAARAEFIRILKPRGVVVLMGIGRRQDGSPFMRQFAELFRKYAISNRAHQDRDERMRAFFAPGEFHSACLEHHEMLDYRVLSGRLLSYSSIPLPGQPGHDEMMRELRAAFDSASVEGRVRYECQVKLSWGYAPARRSNTAITG